MQDVAYVVIDNATF